MKQEFYNHKINTNGQKLYEFTNDTIQWINQNNFINGIEIIVGKVWRPTIVIGVFSFSLNERMCIEEYIVKSIKL